MSQWGSEPPEEEEDEEASTGWEKSKALGRCGLKITVKSDLSRRNISNFLDRPVQSAAKIRRTVNKRPKTSIGSVSASASQLISIVDTFDRKGAANAEGIYTGADAYAYCEDKPGKRIPKAGVYAEAGVGRASAEFSVFDAEAKGPNARAEAQASLLGVGAMARAEVASASASAGPFKAKLGLGVDTGVSAGVDGLEAKILGTGISIGPKTSVSILGSEASCSIM
ncbi:uncharacterized protein LOC115099469 [Rhinatrema bivittatum]|uniref:uncharacterized protein LOC115099469 n=1 Tax=Rhinatrema bivittatum TaxID=194408 RepID=UPI001128F89F|nr:uncharacterized protein LOC115099469 [Rhinatrema bivittatum]